MPADAYPEQVEKKLEQLPATPGVYLFLNEKGKPIYIGKATSLRSRVRSYFGKNEDGRIYFPHIVRAVCDIDWVVAGSNREALLLENNLIKQHKPRFNVRLVDDKTYLSIKVTTNEPYPRALLVRRAKKDKAIYFGPYGSAAAIRQTLRTIRKYFPLRTCTNAEFRNRTRPCIQHQIGRCGGPCVGLQDEAAYAKVVDDTVLFLKGKTQELIETLTTKMAGDAEALRFEAAARTRDQIRWIETTQEKQRAVISIVDLRDRDIFGEVRQGDAVIIQAHFVREGKLVATHGFTLRSELPTDEVLSSFFKQFYAADRYLPDEILFPIEPDDRELIEEWLTDRKGKRVQILAPERGQKREWVEMARDNARATFRADEEKRAAMAGALEDLKERLGLANVPRRIECYDISNIMGAFAVGSLVTMRDGDLDKSGYKKFKIRTLNAEKTDDFSAMREVLDRRFKRSHKVVADDTAAEKAEKSVREHWALPDLILLDGGKPQLSAVEQIFKARGIEGVDLAAIAKSRSDRGRVIRAAGALGSERIFRPGRDDPVVLPEGSPGMLLLQRLRDEAHRFAIGYHRALRRARSFKTGLEEIPGIGPKRRRALLEHFGSLRKLREASVGDIAGCPLITPTQAESIHQFFHEGDGATIPDEGRATEEEGGDA